MFPLKFGIMFGDIGHGGALLAFGLYLVHKGKDLIGTPLAGFFSIRYLLSMMGFFAFYCGLIYNDFLSLPINLFGSCYRNIGEIETEKVDGCVYPFGIDPKWFIANNELNFFNSYKMKRNFFVFLFFFIYLFGFFFVINKSCCYFWSYLDALGNFLKRT
jgi:V-type H+-transporting ATPase subunit a